MPSAAPRPCTARLGNGGVGGGQERLGREVAVDCGWWSRRRRFRVYEGEVSMATSLRGEGRGTAVGPVARLRRLNVYNGKNLNFGAAAAGRGGGGGGGDGELCREKDEGEDGSALGWKFTCIESPRPELLAYPHIRRRKKRRPPRPSPANPSASCAASYACGLWRTEIQIPNEFFQVTAQHRM
uniref:Uncharacterized protein n=1 Tax=Setaria viridis TaxID=4556 RepID=A0A4U6UT65_SETVI|nr:hypothetical protein SEVIR_5G351900v2 [Setaria viridis]